MPDTEWVDTREEADARRKEQRRGRLKLLLPLFYLLLLIAVVLGIVRYNYVQNREDTLALSENLVRALEQRIISQVEIHLLAATRVVDVASWVYRARVWPTETVAMFETIGMKALELYPQLQSFQVGAPDGSFLMTRRMSDGSVHTKTILVDDEQRDVRWIRRDPGGNIIGVETVPDDTYDPRERLWYEGAVRADTFYWTDVYIFFTGRKPGVTAALAVFGPDGEASGVLSVDIELEGLSRFLADLKIGQSGTALIMDEQGQLVAYPAPERMLEEKNGVPTPVMVDTLEDPVLTRAFDRFRIEGYGMRKLTVEGEIYSSITASLEPMLGKKWTVLITVPQEDFVGFLSKNIQRSLLFSMIAFGMVAWMVGFLLRRSLQSERTSRILDERRRRMERQSQAFTDLTSVASSFVADQSEFVEPLSEIVSNRMKIRRVSLWRMNDDQNRLTCIDSYDRESDGHTRGAELERRDFPLLFEALLVGEEIRTTDVEGDPRTREISKAYLKPFGCCSLLTVPVRFREKVVGCVWFEHDGKSRGWGREDTNLAHSLAGMLALRFGVTSHRAVRTGPDESVPRPSGVFGGPCVSEGVGQPLPAADKMHATSLISERERGQLRSEVIEGISVMVLRFTDPFGLAGAQSPDAPESLFEDLVRRIERMAEARGVEYLKLMGEQMVFATGFDGAAGHAPRIADLALSIQEALMTCFADRNAPMGFRIGIDTGAVFGSLVGKGEPIYNLWGHAVNLATSMAETGMDGGIQVTQSAYGCLLDEYIFKLRGGFYMVGVGEIRTYLLRGKL